MEGYTENHDDLQTFINKCFRKTFMIFWPNVISDAELWRNAQQGKPVAVQFQPQKCKCTVHTLGKYSSDIKKQGLRLHSQ